MATKCPKCQSENPETAAFCADCGTRIRGYVPDSPESGTYPQNSEGTSVSVTKTIISPVAEGIFIAGRYRILDKLGEGGMGVVHKAEDTRLKRTVALKFLPPELTKETEAKERFIREAQAAAALSHPHICTIYEVDEVDGKSFISMEYVEGQSIRERIKKGPLNLAEALGISIQAAQGLEEAHKKGIVHRDIKSVNIMVTGAGQAKVMDFGLAKVFGASLITKEAKTMGTVAYMSPEQAQGQSVDHRTDIWSLGVVIYEMLTGQLPFGGDHEGSLGYAIVHEPPRPLREANPKLKPELERVVEKALEKKPSNRYQSMGEMLEDLKALAEGLSPMRARARFFKGRILGIKKAPFFAGIIAIVVIIGFAIRMMKPSGGVEVLDSIAILPLVNDSGDPSQDYFASSLTDMLIAEFYKVSALRVAPRQSVLAYAKTIKSPQQIAKELDVKAIVEASVLKSENKVRLIARLIDPTENKQIWGDTLEREYSDILFLQSELAQAIVKGVKVAVKPEERALLASARKVNPEAYDLVMQGIELYIKGAPQGTKDPLSQGLDYFQRAIDIDPSLALAYAWKALFYNEQARSWRANGKEILPKAREAVLKALELDDNLAMAHSTFALVELSIHWDFAGAEQEFKRGMELAPGDWMIPYFYETFLCWAGRGDEAIAHLKRRHKERKSGMESLFTLRLVYNLLWAARYDEALEEIANALSLDDEYRSYYMRTLAIVNALKGIYSEALAEIDKSKDWPAWKTNPWFRRDRAWILALCGRREKALEALEEHKSLHIDTTYDEACVYAGLGDIDRAFEYLNKACENHSPQMVQLVSDWCLHSLHGDPRFEELARKVGFPVSPQAVSER